MKKIIVLSMSFIIVMIFLPILMSGTASHDYKTQKDLLKEISEFKGQGHALGVIGDYKVPDKAKSALEHRDISGLSQAENIHGLIIAEDQAKKILGSGNSREVQTKLNNGVTIFFQGSKITGQEVADFLDYDINLIEGIEGNQDNVEHFQYVSKDQNDKLVFGTIVGNKNINKETLHNNLIMESWLKRENSNRRGELGKQSEFQTSEYNSVFMEENVTEASIDHKSVGADWNLSFGPREYTFTTDHGHLFERKRGYYLNRSSASKEYTALTMFWESVPDGTGDSVESLRFTSDASTSNTTSAGIEKYGPTSQPSSNTMSYSIGLSGNSLGFTASWNVQQSDLTHYNNSCISCGSVDISFDFDRSSSYASGTTVHEPALSYNANSGVNEISMSNQRYATFYGWGYQGTQYVKYADSTNSPNYLTNVNVN